MLVLRAVTLQWLLLAVRRPAPVVVLLVVGVVVEARASPPTMHELGKRQCWQPRKVLTIRCDGKVSTHVGCVEVQYGCGVSLKTLRYCVLRVGKAYGLGRYQYAPSSRPCLVR